MMKMFKRLEKKLFRQQEKLKEINKKYENVMIGLKILENSTKLDETEQIDETRINIAESTPRKRADDFINENIPTVETPKKEAIKQKLVEYNILTESLKREMRISNNTEKNTFKIFKIMN